MKMAVYQCSGCIEKAYFGIKENERPPQSRSLVCYFCGDSQGEFEKIVTMDEGLFYEQLAYGLTCVWKGNPKHGIVPEPFKRGFSSPKVLAGIQQYVPEATADNVVAFMDTTLLGNGSGGITLTRSGFHVKTKNKQPESCKYMDIEEAVDFCGGQVLLKLKSGDDIWIDCGRHFNSKNLCVLINFIIQSSDSCLTDEVDNLELTKLDASAKRPYVKLVVNALHMDDERIDEREFAELQLLMTRTELTQEERDEISAYIVQPCLTDAQLISVFRECTPKGAERFLGVILLKDLITIFASLKEENSGREKVLQHYQKLFYVSESELDLIRASIDLELAIASGEVSDAELEKKAKRVASIADAVGVPVGVLFLSGSVIGVSSAVFSSSVGVIGLGTTLGLSLTGVGGIVVLGLAAVKGTQWLAGQGKKKRDELEKAAQREVLLNEIIITHQKTLANMARDISKLAQDIANLKLMGEENNERFRQLLARLKLYARSSNNIGTREEHYEKKKQDNMTSVTEAEQ
ncbi:hypothetical protein L4D08_22135 [Photobacterium chitinilyticum]|uniref:hypothetical protein n=1 Tax=Photobacterium chitinilyticum TaxID=2485123 RepID=UPI003D1310FC